MEPSRHPGEPSRTPSPSPIKLPFTICITPRWKAALGIKETVMFIFAAHSEIHSQPFLPTEHTEQLQLLVNCEDDGLHVDQETVKVCEHQAACGTSTGRWKCDSKIHSMTMDRRKRFCSQN
ncbi:hypothetical protein TRVL_08073 [Trypanosoma vivax]|nr:hypothetical protein TRVL_08073 [Trypanosoma vivax]